MGSLFLSRLLLLGFFECESCMSVAYWASHLNCILHPSLPIRLIRLLFTFFVLYLSFLFNSRREKTCFSRNVSHFRHFHLLFRYFIITIFIAIGSNWYTPCNVAYENKCISLSFRRLISIFVQQISTLSNRFLCHWTRNFQKISESVWSCTTP